MPWNTSGTFAVRLSVETLTANREILWPDIDGTIAVGAGIGSGVSLLTLHRVDMTAEGGELRLNRAADDGLAWAIDCFGSGSVATAMRFIDAKAAAVRMFIDQSSGSVVMDKLAVSGTATHSGFTLLGESSPSIKCKKLTGTTAATEGGNAAVAHGLTYSKILGMQVLIDTGTVKIPDNHGEAGFNAKAYFDSTNFNLTNKAADSASILSKSFAVVVTYEA